MVNQARIEKKLDKANDTWRELQKEKEKAKVYGYSAVAELLEDMIEECEEALEEIPEEE